MSPDRLTSALDALAEDLGPQVKELQVEFRIKPGPEQETVRALIWQWANLNEADIECRVHYGHTLDEGSIVQA